MTNNIQSDLKLKKDINKLKHKLDNIENINKKMLLKAKLYCAGLALANFALMGTVSYNLISSKYGSPFKIDKHEKNASIETTFDENSRYEKKQYEPFTNEKNYLYYETKWTQNYLDKCLYNKIIYDFSDFSLDGITYSEFKKNIINNEKILNYMRDLGATYEIQYEALSINSENTSALIADANGEVKVIDDYRYILYDQNMNKFNGIVYTQDLEDVIYVPESSEEQKLAIKKWLEVFALMSTNTSLMLIPFCYLILKDSKLDENALKESLEQKEKILNNR